MIRTLIIIGTLLALMGAPSLATIKFAPMPGMAASVEGTYITLVRLNKALELAKKDVEKEEIGLTKEANSLEGLFKDDGGKDMKKTVLLELIDEILISRGAVREGIEPKAKEIKKKIDELKGRFQSQAEFHRSIGEQGMTVEDLEKNIKRQLVVEGLEKILKSRIVVSDEDLKAFYDKNIEIFIEPKKVGVLQIVVADKELADRIRSSIEAGSDFGELAKTYSIDTETAIRGGNVGLITRGKLNPTLEDAAFTLTPGSISEVIELEDGFHILKATERIGGRETTFEQARSKIREFLLEEKAAIAFSNWLEGQRITSDIVINEKLKFLFDNEQGKNSPAGFFVKDIS